MKKTFLFVKDTYYKDGKLTGAHKRFLELVRGVSKIGNVILITREIPQLDDIEATRYLIGEKRRNNVPMHISGMIDLGYALKRIKNKIHYDYAISFGPTNTICLKWCGYHNIVSLFREDLIGYQKAIDASRIKTLYSSWQEKQAVKYSDKIIVQCENDRKNLIERNIRRCENIEKKVYIQINNANASWMNTSTLEHAFSSDGVVRILFIGDFSDSRKGHSILLPAVSKLIYEGMKINLFVAGNGRELDSYKKQYAEYRAIEFLGRVNVAEYLSKCDFSIVPSLIDSCPNTILEALNAGVAVYGTNTGGIPDLLLNNKYLFNANVDDVYKFLKDIITTHRYVQDTEDQKEIKRRLTFDWANEIIGIIERE